MKVKFLGASRIVTGSNILVETENEKFLIDCGMFQGSKELEKETGRILNLILLRLILCFYPMLILTIAEEFQSL